jgi:uncharacterized protein YeaO (DUF488 family)/DNA-binding MarR family transcriptional regulator
VVLPDAAYTRLLALRTGLRHFERWSEQQARAAGLTPAQHQLLLAIRGHDKPLAPTVGEVADYLLLRHHSTVGLVDRAEDAGLVYRTRDEEDHRVVRLHLTDAGAESLEALSALHLEELDRLALKLPAAWRGLAPVQRRHGFRALPAPAEEPARPAHKVVIAHAYETGKRQGLQVLVDRAWPRGLARGQAAFDEWLRDIAPTAELRRWYRDVPGRFEEFSRRYRKELVRQPGRGALGALRAHAAEGKLTLVTATKDLEHSAASVLRGLLAE